MGIQIWDKNKVLGTMIQHGYPTHFLEDVLEDFKENNIRYFVVRINRYNMDLLHFNIIKGFVMKKDAIIFRELYIKGKIKEKSGNEKIYSSRAGEVTPYGTRDIYGGL